MTLAGKLFNSDINSDDVSAEKTLDSQKFKNKKFGQKMKNKVIGLFSKGNDEKEGEGKGMKL